MAHPEFLSGQRGYAEDVTSLAVRGSYTPLLTATTTDPDIGVLGSAVGDFYVTGSLVTVAFGIVFASGADAGSGQYRISLPPGLDFDASWARQTYVGQARLRDDSGPSTQPGHPTVPVSAGVNDRFEIVLGSSGFAGSRVADGTPWTWASGDSLRGTLTYLLAD